MIPDVIGVVGLVFLSLCIGIEVCDGQGVGVKSPNRDILLFARAVCHLFALVSAHDLPPICLVEKFSKPLSTVINFNYRDMRSVGQLWSTSGQLSYRKL